MSNGKAVVGNWIQYALLGVFGRQSYKDAHYWYRKRTDDCDTQDPTFRFPES